MSNCWESEGTKPGGKRGPNIPAKVEKIIKDDSLRCRNKDRDILAYELKEKIENIGFVSPTIEVLKRKISHYRNHTKQLDMPWHMGTLKDYELNPDAIAKIFELKAKLNWEGMTLREAIWVSRFSKLPISLDMLRMQATLYAFGEDESEIAEKELFDTYGLDKDLVKILNIPDFANAKLFVSDEELGEVPKNIKDFRLWIKDYETKHSQEEIQLFRMLPEPKDTNPQLLCQFYMELGNKYEKLTDIYREAFTYWKAKGWIKKRNEDEV